MNKVLLTLMLFLTLVVNRSCESDDLNDTTIAPNLNGLWKLTTIEGGFANVNYQFDEGEITWDFNIETNKLNVINNNTGNENYDGLQTGEYEFSIIQFDAILLIDINNENFGSYYIEGNNLIINQDGATSGNTDGYVLSFMR